MLESLDLEVNQAHATYYPRISNRFSYKKSAAQTTEKQKSDINLLDSFLLKTVKLTVVSSQSDEI